MVITLAINVADLVSVAVTHQHVFQCGQRTHIHHSTSHPKATRYTFEWKIETSTLEKRLVNNELSSTNCRYHRTLCRIASIAINIKYIHHLFFPSVFVIRSSIACQCTMAIGFSVDRFEYKLLIDREWERKKLCQIRSRNK